MYEEAKSYYKQYGNLEIPYKYKTPDGYSLGHWILTQKRVRAGEQFVALTEERIEKLDAIGMCWESRTEVNNQVAWDKRYGQAKLYNETHGNLPVPSGYVYEDGYRLGIWILNQRNNHSNPRKYRSLTDDETKRLEEIDMVWYPNQLA